MTQELTKDDLRGCPFCAGEGEIEEIESGSFSVGCPDCDFQLMTGPIGLGWHKSVSDAVGAWNERHADLCIEQLQNWTKNLQAQLEAANKKISELEQGKCLNQIAEPDAQHLQELAAYRFTVENLREHVAELEARLEIDYRHPYDGIAARDATIKAQDERIAELEAELEAVGAGGVQRLAAEPQAITDEREAFVNWLHGTYPNSYSIIQAADLWFHKHVAALAWKARAAIAATHPSQQGMALDAERWRMTALISRETMIHPDKRKYTEVVAAYMHAVHSGLDIQGAVDSALAAKAKQCGA